MVAGSRAASPCRRWSKGTEPTTVSERAVPSCYLLESVQRLAERQEPLDPLLGPNSNSHASCAAELSIGLLKPSSPAARIKIPCGAGQDELTNSLARRCKGGRIHRRSLAEQFSGGQRPSPALSEHRRSPMRALVSLQNLDATAVH
jgi:hypothetical protein